MKNKYVMVVDSSKCFNCKACIVACQMENKVPVGNQRNWVKHGFVNDAQQIHFQPGNCMHCDKPTCVEACPTGATFKSDKDGIVDIDKNLCIGCGSCIPSCPYGARYANPTTRIVDKCEYCTDRRLAGLEPACVEICPTHARVFGDILDDSSQVAKLLHNNKIVRIINSTTNTEPAMYYVNETTPMDWTVPAEPPAPIKIWKDFAGTMVKAAVGLSGIGVLTMLGKQIFTRDETVN